MYDAMMEKGGSEEHSAIGMRLCGGWRENEMHGCSTGKQTRFDMDVPHPWPCLKEMFEIIGPRSNSSSLFLVYLLKLE